MVQRGARKLRTKANPSGQPLSTLGQPDSMTLDRMPTVNEAGEGIRGAVLELGWSSSWKSNDDC